MCRSASDGESRARSAARFTCGGTTSSTTLRPPSTSLPNSRQPAVDRGGSMSPSSPNPGEAGRLFREGNLADALTAANAAVRKTPTDIGARVLQAELLAFAGNIERADVVLDACADLDPTAALAVAEVRQLLRGQPARR